MRIRINSIYNKTKNDIKRLNDLFYMSNNTKSCLQFFTYPYIDGWTEQVRCLKRDYIFPLGLIYNINITTKGKWTIMQVNNDSNVKTWIIILKGTGNFNITTSVLPYMCNICLSCTMPYILTYNFKYDFDHYNNIVKNSNVNIKIDNNIFNMSKGKIICMIK